MTDSFLNILVPVTFKPRDNWAIVKAIELANVFNCNIHLVYVVKALSVSMKENTIDNSFLYEKTAHLTNIRHQLEQLRDEYRQQVCGNVKIEISLLKGNRSKQLTEYIKRFEMDMVVIGLPKFNLVHRILSSVTISKLSRKTNVPVLAIRFSGLVRHFKKIVLPVTGEIPIRRIQMATLLARSFKSTIYLVGLTGDDNRTAQILGKTLDIVQSISTIPVQCFWLEGKNLAKSTLEFSKKINADLILINPLKEFQLPGWWSSLTSNFLSYRSPIPVITVDKGI